MKSAEQFMDWLLATALFWVIFLLLILVTFLVVQKVFACPYDELIRTEAHAHGIPEPIALGICHAESSGHPYAVGRAGERGLFQITLDTWQRINGPTAPFDLAFDPIQNAITAMKYLALIRYPHIDPRNYLSWYNAGRRNWQDVSLDWTTNHPNHIYRRLYRTLTP